MTQLGSNDAVDELFRQMNEELGLTLPLEGVPLGMETMMLPPPPAPPTTPVREQVPIEEPRAPRKKKRAVRTSDPGAVARKLVITEQPPLTTSATLPIQWGYLGDPKEYVNDLFDKVIAPSVFEPRSIVSTMRHHIYRRAIGEFAVADLRDRGQRGAIGLEDIVSVTIKGCEKVGINLNL